MEQLNPNLVNVSEVELPPKIHTYTTSNVRKSVDFNTSKDFEKSVGDQPGAYDRAPTYTW